jgi:hypothetical protein
MTARELIVRKIGRFESDCHGTEPSARSGEMAD